MNIAIMADIHGNHIALEACNASSVSPAVMFRAVVMAAIAVMVFMMITAGIRIIRKKRGV